MISMKPSITNASAPKQYLKVGVVDEVAYYEKIVGGREELHPAAFGVGNLHKVESVAVFTAVVKIKREGEIIFIVDVVVLYQIDIQ